MRPSLRSAAAVAVVVAAAAAPSLRPVGAFTVKPPPCGEWIALGSVARSSCAGFGVGVGGADDADAGPHTFGDLGLGPDLLLAVRRLGWDVPTPVQRLAVPAVLGLGPLGGGSDRLSVWAEAPTGSGKTGGFALPLVQILVRERRDRIARGDGPGTDGRIASLVLCPTRELAAQIGGVFEDISGSVPKGRGASVMTIHGGVPIDPQVEALARRRRSGAGLDVLVATPGRLVDVMRGGKGDDPAEAALERRLLAALDATGRTDATLTLAQIEEMELDRVDDEGRASISDMLEGVRYLVLDEADRLLGQAFKSEMDEVLKLLPRAGGEGEEGVGGGGSDARMKTMLFSATFPEQILPRVETVLRRLSGSAAPPLRLSCSLGGMAPDPEGGADLSHRRQKRLEKATKPASVLEGPASTITLRAIRIEERDRTMALRRLLEEYGPDEWDRVLVFTSTRYASEHVSRKLRRAGIRSAELHGRLDQAARSRRLDDFKRGRVRVLLATDLASRGLDVAGLPAVVNYDLPRSTADFTHRIGRTGRAGRTGTAVSFVTPSNEAHFDLIERRHRMGVEREVLPGLEPDEGTWRVRSEAARLGAPGARHSEQGLVHDRMHGGVKGRRKSKKDKLREAAAREARKK